jgi:23S rRNA (uracil1939-C5)-methyltransferase
MKDQSTKCSQIRIKMIRAIIFGLSFTCPTIAFTPPRLEILRSTTSLGLSTSPRRKGGNKSKKKPTSKWEQQRGNKFTPKPRPTLTDYAENTNLRVNQARLDGAINCEHFDVCAGCVVNERVGEVDVIQSAKRYFSSTAVRKNRVDVQENGEDWVVEEQDDGFYKVVVPTGITEWRTQAKLVVAAKSSSWANAGCVFGLYKRGSHHVQEIPQCSVHHPSINRAVKALEKATDTAGTAAYSKESREGGLRYVQLQVERSTGKICLTLVWFASELKYTQPALSRVTKALATLEPDLWHSMWCHCNESPGNNIFNRNPKGWYRLSGNEFVKEPLPVGDYGWLYFSPLTFRQGNMDGFDILALDVAKSIPGGSKVCELYAGVGLLGLTSLVHHAQPESEPLTWVRCSDENPANVRSFTRSLSSM